MLPALEARRGPKPGHAGGLQNLEWGNTTLPIHFTLALQNCKIINRNLIGA